LSSQEIASHHNRLQSKIQLYRLQELKMKEPEISVSGSLDAKLEIRQNLSYNNDSSTIIVTESSNFRKEIDLVMSYTPAEPFIKIPRDLLEDPNWKGLRLKYQRLFLIILQHVAYHSRIYKYNGNSIKIKPGQLCISFRKLVDLYNQDVKFKNERRDLPLVQRGVSVFSDFSWAIHESIHGITIITITHRALCEHYKKMTDTGTDTESIRNRYTNEERKEDNNTIGTFNDVDTPPSFENEKSEPYYPPQVLPEVEQFQISEDQFKQDFFLIDEMVKSNKIPITSQELERWIRKWGGVKVVSTVQLMISQKNKIDKPGAWMETALKDDWAKLKRNVPINKKFAEEFKEKNNWIELTILQKYCTIERIGYDLQFNSSPEMFRKSLEEKYENLFREHDGEINY